MNTEADILNFYCEVCWDLRRDEPEQRGQERLGLVECCGNNLELLLAILVAVVPRLFFPFEAIGYGNELGGYDNALVVVNLIILAVEIISQRVFRPNLRLIHGDSEGSSLQARYDR